MEILLYMLIVLIATTLGSLAGLGGGIIIKPLLDLIHLDNTIVINLYSSIAVFMMSIVAMYHQFKVKNTIEIKKVVLLAMGSVIGGLVGEQLFNYLYAKAPIITAGIQNLLLAIILIIVLIYSFMEDKIKTKHYKNIIIIVLVGLALGFISVLCGIGGGPLNLIVLSLFFSMSLKSSILSSIVIIFFSQGTKILSSFFDKSIYDINFEVTIFIIISAIFGALIGSKLNDKMPNNIIIYIYRITLVLILCISIVNMFVHGR